MQRVAVLNVVGLTPSLIGPHTPELRAFRQSGRLTSIRPAFPAVTCTAQANYLTGLEPSRHGIVANGWYDRELAEVQFWKQSNHLVRGRKVWEELRKELPGFTCAKLFWWYNMYASADYSITPRPLYPANGRKVFDIHTWPYDIRSEIKRDLGEFPFPTFWGPAAGVPTPLGSPDAATRWIAASAQWIEQRHRPTLSLVYLPHLDYNLQRLGPDHPDLHRDLAAIDRIVGELIRFYREHGVRPLLLSEYGVTAVQHPIHLNRLFRQKGWITVKDELGRETLDAGASRAFAVADHQVAHVYVADPTLLRPARQLIEGQAGVERVFGASEKKEIGLDHNRAGDLVVVARENAWFTYYYWLEDRRAPDFARCVDIHRKPGYDPVELFLDPGLRFPKLKILLRRCQSRMGFRTLMDLIPLDASLVRGSHGRVGADPAHWPLLISEQTSGAPSEAMPSTAVYRVIRDAVLAAD